MCVLLMIEAFGGCTSDTGASRETAPTNQNPGPPVHQVTLGCHDGVRQGIHRTAVVLRIGPVTFGGLRAPLSSVPLTEDVGLTLPWAADWHFRKAPLVVKGGESRISITSRSARSALVWVPYDVWTSGSPVDARPWATRSVQIHACPTRSVSYLGGIVAEDPSTCLVLRVRSSHGAAEVVRRRLDGQTCAAGAKTSQPASSTSASPNVVRVPSSPSIHSSSRTREPSTEVTSPPSRIGRSRKSSPR